MIIRRWVFMGMLLIGGGTLLHHGFSSSSEKESLLVAVIDSGVDDEHPDLKGRVMKGIDFVDWDFDPMDEHGHGTHVASQITSRTQQATILAIRTLDENGKGNGEALFGVLYALLKGADIVNMSYSESYNVYTRFLIWFGQQRGTIFVASTGNDGESAIDYPAKYEGVIAIGGVNEYRNTLYEEGNIDESVQFVAPGVAVEGADLHNTHTNRTGTSMATGYASGVIAYVLEQHPDFTREALLAYLKKNSEKAYEGNYKQLEYERILALHEPKFPYGNVLNSQEIPLTDQLSYNIPIETINVERIEAYDEQNQPLLSTTNWEETLAIPLIVEGNQEIILRFYQGEQYQEKTFWVSRDTKKPKVTGLRTEYDTLSFVITEANIENVTINGESAQRNLRANRQRAYTYHVMKPIEENTSFLIEITDKVGHKITKFIFN